MTHRGQDRRHGGIRPRHRKGVRADAAGVHRHPLRGAGQRPAFGRSYQSPYADRIRNELTRAGLPVAVIAVGAISSYEDVNSLILPGCTWSATPDRVAGIATPDGGRPHAMATCEVCGNDYRLSFEVHAAGAVHTFDSFECAIHALAPVCEHCGVRVVGHGVEADGVFYCCAHCARQGGVRSAAELVDSAGNAPVLDEL